MRENCVRFIFLPGLIVSAGLSVHSLFGQTPGPGIPAISYAQNQLFTVISQLNSANGAPRGHGSLSMVNGYLFVIFSNDGGGGDGSGGFAFFNLANPYAPANIFTTSDNPAYNSGTNYPGEIREGHAFSFSGPYACIPTRRGLQFWNFANVGPPANAPVKVGEIHQLSGVAGGDYAPTPWWVCWQGGRYVYVAGTSTGLHIIDATNPAAPVYVNRGAGKPNPIPTSQTGGFVVGTVFAIGNLLVITGHDANGMATLDISDPVNPVLLNVNGASPGYSAMVNDGKILGMGDPLNVWNIADNGVISLLRNAPDAGGKGGYGVFQDGFVFMGNSSNTSKIDIRNPAGYSVVGKVFPIHAGTDMDFCTAIGNLQFASDDHGIAATYISPHQTAPDTTGPSVNWISPRPNAVNQAFTSRVGVTFTDTIDIRTVNASTFIVRPFGASPLPGTYSYQSSIVNFWPDAPLVPNETYEVFLPAGGVKDFSGNGIPTSYSSLFSTGAQIITFDVICSIANGPALVGQTATMDIVSCTGADASGLLYSWNFGDGTPPTTPSPTSSSSHVYTSGGHYTLILTVSKGAAQRSFSASQTVTYPLVSPLPRASSTIVYDAARQRIWLTNPDSHTVAAIDAVALTKVLEVSVGKHPRTLAQAPDGAIWVTNVDDATLSVLDPVSAATVATVPMPYGSRPFGIAFSPAGQAFVTLDARGELIRIDPVSRTITGTASVGPTPRGIAISGNSSRVLVTRFNSPVSSAEVREVNPATMTVVRTFTLALDPGTDAEDAGRGVPNYLLSATISPDGRRAWIPSKKDNTLRGLYRDGLPLTFENTVRAIVSQLDLNGNIEVLSARRDLNDRSLPAAVALNGAGDYAFVVTLGSNSLEVLDAYNGAPVTGIDEVGLAPQGLVFNADFTRLFVHNYMSRDVAVYDVADVGQGNNLSLLAQIDTVATELLSSQVLLGKQVFYNAADRKMSRDRYISCAMCHLDGDSDGRVWDFTDRGEGLRNTISLVGKGGMRQGPVHWTANFNEIQDFENDIRNEFGGEGFMTNLDFSSRYDPLGPSKSGFSSKLDALAAYVASLKKTPASPYRNSDGTMMAEALAGEAIFRSATSGCRQCHSGSQLTDSDRRVIPYVLHNVGTITPASGQRIGAPLTGLDTPTLKNLWETPPYLHDGSAATLMDVITTKNPGDQHGNTSHLTPAQKQQLVAYLLAIESFSRADMDADHDVDQTDFGLFQSCMVDYFGPFLPGCDAVDLDDDSDVDIADANIFHPCIRGADIPADPNCAN